jgi:hypothetical protein
MFKTLERQSPKVDHNDRLQRDVWHSICNSKYEVLQRRKGFGVFETPKLQSPEVDHSRQSRGMFGTQYITSSMKYFGRKGFGAFETPECRSAEVTQCRRNP